MTWTYTGRDAGICLFDACLTAGAPMAFTPGMRVLEVGSCESDWLERATDAWPDTEFVGLDQRDRPTKHPRVALMTGDVRNPDLFPAASFDAVVSLSAIEHVGLGHYGDPVDPDGDMQAVQNIARWLKPGGWFYFDVPFDPTSYRVMNTECRVYDGQALASRFMAAWSGPMQIVGYSDSRTPGTLLTEAPSEPAKRYFYAAMVFTRSSPETSR